MHQQQTAFENTVGKGELAHNEQVLLFTLCFLFNQIIVSPFVHIYDIISLFAAEYEKPKIGISGIVLSSSAVVLLDEMTHFCKGKKSCVSTGVRKPGNTYASPTAMI